ncbi:MAG: ABC transporter ATP-binding protein [Hyphomicrobiaceae bacterium]|nr:MAG: ABC transporter ATP-binding protein [Hyphomicrobiaceae bacterium]
MARSNGDTILAATGLTKRYGGLIANNAVSMKLRKGEIRGLIGPNGAGKTTFVNLITGIETPDAGSVLLSGIEIVDLEPNRIAHAGLVRSFQVARIFPNLSVTENMLVPFLAAGAPGGARSGLDKAAELLKLATLDPLARAPAGSLSGGQRMLLQACTGFMIPGVRLFVLDEPFAGINPVVKDTLIDLIISQNKTNGITFLIVSHEMEIVKRLCPRVTVMIAGAVAAEGTLEEIARREDVIEAYLGRGAA